MSAAGPAPRPWWWRRWPETVMLLVLVLAPFAAPLINASADTLTRALIWGLFGLGFDLLFGYTGLLSFGQSAFYGAGGFVTGWLLTSGTLGNTWLALLVGVAFACLYGVAVGYISLRRVGIYFAMITLAFGEMSYFLENAPLSAWTGGENGLPGVPAPRIALGSFHYTIHSGWPMYVFVAAVFFLGFVLARRVVGSPFGMVMRAIRSNPARTPALGHAVPRYKLSVFALAAAYAGLAGGLLAMFQGYMPPEAFDLATSGQLVLSTVIGGAGTLVGPLLGSFIWIYMRETLQHFAAIGGLWKLIFGAVFVLIVTVFRYGIAGEIARRLRPKVQIQEREGYEVPEAAPESVTLEPRPGVDEHASPVLQVGGLTRRFGGLTAVSEVTFDVRAGELFAIIGPNGAGKSTMLKMLVGEMPPSSGTVRFLGEDITGVGQTDICHRGIGKTNQINQLYVDFTVLENVQVAVLAHRRGAFRMDFLRDFSADRASREEAERILDTVDLLELARRPVAELAYGEKRRLEIALALAGEPRLLLMDEPLAGMSPPERAATVRLVNRLAAERTVILVEHDMDAVFRLADRILVMHNGNALVVGEPKEIQADATVQEAYLGGVHAA